MSNKIRFVTFLLLLLIAACVPIFNLSNRDSATRTPFDEAFMQTATARALQQSDSGDELATEYANATALSRDVTAQADLKNAARQATETAISPVLEELPLYGVLPMDGDVAWLHDPVTIELSGSDQFGYANDHPEITAADFVMAADITWNTESGSAGCGFFFRSDGNSEKPNQFAVYIARYANGVLVFNATVEGKDTYMQVYYPNSMDQSFNWLNDSTNRLAVTAQGKLIYFYTNGKMIGLIDTTNPPPATTGAATAPQIPANASNDQLQDYYQMLSQYAQINEQMQAEMQKNKDVPDLADGFLGFIAARDSGHTLCKFSNAWLFKIRQIPTITPNRTWTITPTLSVTPTLTSTPYVPKNTVTPGSSACLPLTCYDIPASQFFPCQRVCTDACGVITTSSCP